MVLTLLQKCQRARQITGCVQSDSGHVMNWGQDSLSASPPLGLPSCQGGNGHKGPQLYVPTTQRTGDQFMFINVPSHTEESLCRPVLQGPFPPEPAAQTPEGGWGPGHCPRYHSCHSTWLWESISSLGKTLNSSHFPKMPSLPPSLWWSTLVVQNCFNCNWRARAALQNFKIDRQMKKRKKENQTSTSREGETEALAEGQTKETNLHIKLHLMTQYLCLSGSVRGYCKHRA